MRTHTSHDTRHTSRVTRHLLPSWQAEVCSAYLQRVSVLARKSNGAKLHTAWSSRPSLRRAGWAACPGFQLLGPAACHQTREYQWQRRQQTMTAMLSRATEKTNLGDVAVAVDTRNAAGVPHFLQRLHRQRHTHVIARGAALEPDLPVRGHTGCCCVVHCKSATFSAGGQHDAMRACVRD